MQLNPSEIGDPIKARIVKCEGVDIIGGAIVHAGDIVIDASVRGQLRQLQNTSSV